MTDQKQPLWETYLKPLISLLLDKDSLQKLRYETNWEGETKRLHNPNLIYPRYYTDANFHGVKQGYLNPDAAVTYDPITQYALPPNETWIREELIDRIQGSPRRILDLGCGTGSTTVMLKTAYPDAEIVGLDLSPYMLIMAEKKSREANLDISWHHGLAEATGWESEQFDIVTASLLFHETPPAITKAILQEAFRLLTPGGQCLILDGNQSALRQTEWLTDIFEEPYIKAFAAGDLAMWMQQAGLTNVCSESVWWVHQVTRSQKPLPVRSQWSSPVTNSVWQEAAPAF